MLEWASRPWMPLRLAPWFSRRLVAEDMQPRQERLSAPVRKALGADAEDPKAPSQRSLTDARRLLGGLVAVQEVRCVVVLPSARSPDPSSANQGRR